MIYIRKPPRLFCDSDWAWNPDVGSPSNITIHCDEPNTFSGLYDAEGNEMHRVRQPVGFVLSTVTD